MPKGEVLCTHFDEGVMYQKDKGADSQVYKCSVTKATLFTLYSFLSLWNSLVIKYNMANGGVVTV